jgi:hypothetical protein
MKAVSTIMVVEVVLVLLVIVMKVGRICDSSGDGYGRDGS